MQSFFPKPIWLLVGLYFVASVVHFAHNAEFIAFYPGMPAWLTREEVYLSWLAISGVGLAALLADRIGWSILAAILLATYGAFGLDGLAHYTLALCSDHTLATNLSIWFEATAGLALLLASSVLVKRRTARHRSATTGA